MRANSAVAVAGRLFRSSGVRLDRRGGSRRFTQGNLPGWRWARIKQLVLVGLSSSLHSEVCNALGGPSGSPTAEFLSAATCVRAAANEQTYK